MRLFPILLLLIVSCGPSGTAVPPTPDPSVIASAVDAELARRAAVAAAQSPSATPGSPTPAPSTSAAVTQTPVLSVTPAPVPPTDAAPGPQATARPSPAPAATAAPVIIIVTLPPTPRPTPVPTPPPTPIPTPPPTPVPTASPTPLTVVVRAEYLNPRAFRVTFSGPVGPPDFRSYSVNGHDPYDTCWLGPGSPNVTLSPDGMTVTVDCYNPGDRGNNWGPPMTNSVTVGGVVTANSRPAYDLSGRQIAAATVRF